MGYRLAVWLCNWLEAFDAIVSICSFTLIQPRVHVWWLFGSRFAEWLEGKPATVRKETHEFLNRE